MQHHPHVHTIVPALAFDSKQQELVHPKNADSFLIHFRPLTQRFRTLMRLILQQLEQDPNSSFKLSQEARASLSAAKEWNVQVKAAGAGKTALRYLARYVQRSAFHPKRLLGYDEQGKVKLRWTDSNTGKQDVLHLHPHEFIRRWLIHVLPKRFVRVRHYGFLSPAAKQKRLLIRALLGELGEPEIELPDFLTQAHQCSQCGCTLQIIGTFKRSRPPPWIGKPPS